MHTPNRPRAGEVAACAHVGRGNLLIDSLTDDADPAVQVSRAALEVIVLAGLPIPADLRSAVVQHLRDRSDTPPADRAMPTPWRHGSASRGLPASCMLP